MSSSSRPLPRHLSPRTLNVHHVGALVGLVVAALLVYGISLLAAAYPVSTSLINGR